MERLARGGRRSLPRETFWFVILCAGYGLMAPRNATVVVDLVVCILWVSAALLPILEWDRPFEGLVRISSAPLRDAIRPGGLTKENDDTGGEPNHE
jgi:hypothetical protein